jgi:glycosyltransferase involved in cell wall biosynthesis
MKRILYVQHCSSLGGAPMSLLYLIEQLDRRRFTPEVLFIGGEGDAVKLYRDRGLFTHVRSDISIYPHALNGWLSFKSLRPWEMGLFAAQIIPSARRMRDFLRQNPVDLVHINTSAQLATGLGAAWAGIPIVWHIREPMHPGYLGLRRRLIRARIKKCADAIVAISHRDAAELGQGSNVHVVYNFVDFHRFDCRINGQVFRRELGIEPNRPIIGMLGGIVHSKGADIFIEAAAQVHQKRPDVLFLIAGIPPEGESPSLVKRQLRRGIEKVIGLPNVEKRALRLISRCKLHDTVNFIGMRLDVPEMLAAFDILVWPATVSHFARPVIEAAAMARPVVASDFAHSRELVRNNETGLLLPPNDPQQLAERILFLLDHPEKAGAMGKRAYEFARQRFDAQKNAAAVFSIYDDILNQSHPKANAQMNRANNLDNLAPTGSQQMS